jgi:hypothetical protein
MSKTNVTTENSWRPKEEENAENMVETVIITDPVPKPFSFDSNKTLVVDTGAIIKGVKLEKYASYFYTTSGIVHEIRDSRSKRSLLALPFELEIREPSEESIQIGNSFQCLKS